MDLQQVGAALAAPGRARMLERLLDGQEHTAGELAEAAGVASGTASEHLAVLAAAGLVTVRTDGRFRRVRIADQTVASALEILGRDQPVPEVTSYRLSAEQRRVREARTCYDHLAGRLGVAVHDGFTALGWLDASGSALSTRGRASLIAVGLDIERVELRKRPTLLVCVDWTERGRHLAGGLGAALADLAFERSWVRRVSKSRALRVTDSGREGFGQFGIAATHWSAG